MNKDSNRLRRDAFGGRELFLFVIPTNFGNLANRSDRNVLSAAPESTPNEQINKHSETDLQPITLFFSLKHQWKQKKILLSIW